MASVSPLLMSTLESSVRLSITGLVTVDATSSMAGIRFDWELADVWFASVQKCFGLPAGMGVLVYSPAAVQRAELIGERDHYNSLLFIHENVLKNQTQYTPNGLAIYMLMCVLQQLPRIDTIDAITRERAARWYRFFEQKQSSWKLLVPKPEQRSDTVIAVEGTPEAVKAIKAAALAQGIILGNGYGAWKDTTFRIANFPAIEDEEIAKLKEFLRSHRH